MKNNNLRRAVLTAHYAEERSTKEQLIRKIGEGYVVCTCKVDRHHKNGPEIHKVTNTGIIVIYNERTGKLVTKLIARPNQLKRYFANGYVPSYLFRLAREHQRRGYNNL